MEVTGILKEALIKEAGNMYHDKVFIVENLPRKFLYGWTTKMVPRKDINGYNDGSKVPSQNGEVEETLLEGIEMSATGDGAFLFWSSMREGTERLKAIDRYIERTLPRDVPVPKRVDYAQQIGNSMSGPINYNQIPRVSLKAPEFENPEVPMQSGSPVVSQAVKEEAVPVESEPLVKRGDDKTEKMKKYWEDKRAAQASTATRS